MRPVLAVALASVYCAQLSADEIDVSFNDDAARFEYVHALSRNPLRVDGGWLHHKDNGEVVHIGLNLVDVASDGVTPVTAGLGGRVVYSDGELPDQDGVVAALGGFVRYTFPRYNRLSVTAKVYFAPEVLSVGDADQFQDLSVRVSYNLMREADLYAGARYVKGEYDDAPHARYDTGLHIGISLRF